MFLKYRVSKELYLEKSEGQRVARVQGQHESIENNEWLQAGNGENAGISSVVLKEPCPLLS